MYPNPMGEICVEIMINMHLVVIYFWKYLRNSDIILNFSSYEKRRYGDQAYKIVPKKLMLQFYFSSWSIQLSKILNYNILFLCSRLQSYFHGEVTNLIQHELEDLIHLWEAVRYSHLSSAFMNEVIENSPFFEVIHKTESYQNAKMSATLNGTTSNMTR